MSDLCVDCKQPLSPDECYICETCVEEMDRFADEICGTEFEVADRIRSENDDL